MKTAVLVLSLLLSSTVWGTEYKCRLTPAQLGEVGTRIVRAHSTEKKSVPNLITVRNSLEVATGEGVSGVYEIFVRPLEDETVVLTPLPFLGFDIDKSENVFYICLELQPAPVGWKMTIYSMKGNGLDHGGFQNALTGWRGKKGMKVEPMSVSVIPVTGIPKTITKIFSFLPIVKDLVLLPLIPIDLTLETISEIKSTFASIGVERIIWTKGEIEIAAGIDLKNPESARKIRKIQLKSANAE